MSNLKNIVRNYKKAMSNLQNELKNTVNNHLADMFNDNSNLVSFSWNQYTDFFNDGEPCEFSVSDCGITIVVGEKKYEDVEVYGFKPGVGSKYIDIAAEHVDACGAVLAFVSDLTHIPEVALAAYGDHATVTVCRTDNGAPSTSVEGYTDHD